MTHDELLDKIRNRSELEDCWMALQKVVELHKPSLKDYTQEIGCVGCGINSEWADWQEEWPCPTIQAIEKELE